MSIRLCGEIDADGDLDDLAMNAEVNRDPLQDASLNDEQANEFYRWTYNRKTKREETRTLKATSRQIFVNKDGKIVTGDDKKEEEEQTQEAIDAVQDF